MKTRNLTLALFCLLLFGAFGVWYFHNWVVQKPFAIILFIGDGLVTRNFTATRIYDVGADHRLAIENLPNLALLTTYANDFAVPDSASAATALATGVKVNNGSVSIDPQGANVSSILEAARSAGRATGIICNGSLTDPGVAAFYAHAAKSGDVESIAAQFADKADLDVALGGGGASFSPVAKGGLRKDGRDLMLEMHQKGRPMARSRADLEGAPVFGSSHLVGLFNRGNMAYGDDVAARSQQPSLADMVRRAVELLQYNQHGYVLVVDAELITRAAEQNDGEHVITETVELDRAVSTALDYAGKKALIIAVGKHGTGGMAMNGYPFRQDRGVSVLGTNPFGYPSITWSTGPNGTPTTSPSPMGTPAGPKLRSASQPAAFYAPSAINNAEDVIAAGVGPGSQRLRGFMDNTAIYEILKSNL